VQNGERIVSERNLLDYKRILIVDDEVDALKTLEEASSRNYEIYF
jgi:hypoxanthine phosphoribosyltransferase